MIHSTSLVKSSAVSGAIDGSVAHTEAGAIDEVVVWRLDVVVFWHSYAQVTRWLQTNELVRDS